jgi:hypothetical protein
MNEAAIMADSQDIAIDKVVRASDFIQVPRLYNRA